MSDDVYAIRTTYQDVAELGQGYMERADGERILLALPAEVKPGDGVRFIVYLSDGTPAFAGAGRSVQASDQGAEVDAEARFETLIDALVFDERSRPVYDYIVAVRQMAYADAGAAAEAEAEHGVEEVMESDEPSMHTRAALPATPGAQAAPAAEEVEVSDLDADDAGAPAAPDADAFSDVTPQGAAPALSAHMQPKLAALREQVEVTSRYEPHEDLPEERTSPPSMPTAALPTGSLRRPAVAAQWGIAAPTRPSPTAGSGLFRYPAGSLPVPGRPPRPDLDPSLRVQRAAAPAQ